MDVKGVAAIVTGGGSGMGAEVARQLAKAGAKVTVLDINKANAEKIAQEIGGLGLECDVTSEASVKDAFNAAKAKHGAARILINCAGIAPGARVVGKEGPHDLALFSKVINVNLVGSFNALRIAADDMTRLDPVNDDGERGVIINTASVAAFEGQIGQVAYSASKGGVVGLTLPAARDLAQHGIRVCTIAPGIVDTPLLAALGPEVNASLAASVPFPHRLARPDEYARLACMIVEHDYLNGETIRMDGALRMAPR